MRLTEYTTVDEIIDDLIPVFLNHNGTIPMDWTPARKEVMFSLSKDFTNRLMRLNELLTKDSIEHIYVSPSHFIKAAHKFQNACKNLEYDKQVVLSTYLGLCNAAVLGWNVEVKEAKEKLDSTKFMTCSSPIREKVAYLNSLVRAFSESIYCDDHTIGGDICGPIVTSDGYLLVREYKRLRPTELFGFLEDFRITSIVTYCVYTNNEIEVDLIGNLTKCENMVDTLQKYYIKVVDEEGKTHICEESQLQKLIEYMEEWLKRVIKYYKELSEPEKNRLLFQCEFYAFKPLLDNYGIPWPPQSYDISDNKTKTSKGKELREKLKRLTAQEDRVQCVREILDPRT